MSQYKTLRTWALFLRMLGGVSAVLAAIGVVAWAIEVDGFWETMAVLLFGGPIVVLLAAWPLALGEAMRALADVGDSVSYDSLATTGSGSGSPGRF